MVAYRVKVWVLFFALLMCVLFKAFFNNLISNRTLSKQVKISKKIRTKKYSHHHSLNCTNLEGGFSLMEMMIVIAILGVLASIVYPSYHKHQQQVIRTEAMAELQQVAGRIESNKLIYIRYDQIPLSEIFSNEVDENGNVLFPNAVSAKYTLTVSPKNTTNKTLGGKNWKLTATPIEGAPMYNDGTLSLDATGVKCHKDICGLEYDW